MQNDDSVGMLSKKCMECTHANTLNDCEGKTNKELQRIPCGKWVFDMTLLEEPADEDTQKQADVDTEEILEELQNEKDKLSIENELAKETDELIIDNNVPPANETESVFIHDHNKVFQGRITHSETPADKFRRISANRLKRTLYDLKLLAQFGRLYTQYEWTQAQADEIVAALQKGVDIVKHKLTDKAIK